jgi:hypothetical protein
MPSIAVQAAKVSVTAATAQGRLTVESNSYIFPGTNAWLAKDDGSLSYRVKILACIDTDTVIVRRWPTKPLQNQYEPAHDQESYGPPSYGSSDVSAFDAVASHLSIEAQTAPIDPTYAKRVIP